MDYQSNLQMVACMHKGRVSTSRNVGDFVERFLGDQHAGEHRQIDISVKFASHMASRKTGAMRLAMPKVSIAQWSRARRTRVKPEIKNTTTAINNGIQSRK